MSERAQEFLFVYGSLQRRANHRAHQMLRNHAEFVCRAEFDGELYLVKEYPGVVETKSPQNPVKGELYRLENPALVFEKLDHYEGHYPADPENSLYLREQRTVRSATEPDNIFNAWIYLYNNPTTHLTRISSGDYLSFLEEV